MIAAEWVQVVTMLGTNVRDLRTLLGWSQQELADRAVISQGSISRLESGNHGDIPFHSVVVVLRTLGAAANGLNLPLSLAMRSLLTFTEVMTGHAEFISPDPDVASIIRSFTQLSRRQRLVFLRFFHAAAALVREADRQEVAV